MVKTNVHAPVKKKQLEVHDRYVVKIKQVTGLHLDKILHQLNVSPSIMPHSHLPHKQFSPLFFHLLWHDISLALDVKTKLSSFIPMQLL